MGLCVLQPSLMKDSFDAPLLVRLVTPVGSGMVISWGTLRAGFKEGGSLFLAPVADLAGRGALTGALLTGFTGGVTLA